MPTWGSQGANRALQIDCRLGRAGPTGRLGVDGLHCAGEDVSSAFRRARPTFLGIEGKVGLARHPEVQTAIVGSIAYHRWRFPVTRRSTQPTVRKARFAPGQPDDGVDVVRHDHKGTTDPLVRGERVGRVERWRGGLGFGIILGRGFPGCVSIATCHAPFPPPAHRTGRAVFPHPALGQGFTFSHTRSCGVSQ